MKAVMIMFDSLNRHFLNPYGCKESITPNFTRLAEHSVRFDNCYVGSLPCMPARRELHTGRYNFLHRNWGPLEPFDNSMPEILKQNNIHSHLVSDHGHYWEDGGATYHTRYNTWEFFRGQEGDPWKGIVGDYRDSDPNLINFTGTPREKMYKQNNINKKYMENEEEHSLALTFKAGVEFIETNYQKDPWFLQIECFDPHQPFYTYEKYRNFYPGDYKGLRFDWPAEAPVKESPEEITECRRSYMALLTMCDHYLGTILDIFDKLDLWKDTLLILNTDHGYLLGEHGLWGKLYMPPYEEISHAPLFVWDPRFGKMNENRRGLVQTIDLPATILDFFNLSKPAEMQGVSIASLINENKPGREAGLFGMHGGHICYTDGRYVYMKAPVFENNYPLYNYTLMPTHITRLFSQNEVKTMEKVDPFSFTKEMPIMRFNVLSKSYNFNEYGDLLFDLEQDPTQQNRIKNNSALLNKIKSRMIDLMIDNDCPPEVFKRWGLKD